MHVKIFLFLFLVQNITVNGILMMIFVAYVILSFVYLIGIAKVSRKCWKQLFQWKLFWAFNFFRNLLNYYNILNSLLGSYSRNNKQNN